MKYWDLADLAGEHTNLEAQVEEALRMAERISYPAGIGMGAYASARELLYESLRMRRHLGLPRGYTYSFEQLAQLHESEEHYDRAVQLWAAAETLRVPIGAPLEQVAQKHAVPL